MMLCCVTELGGSFGSLAAHISAHEHSQRADNAHDCFRHLSLVQICSTRAHQQSSNARRSGAAGRSLSSAEQRGRPNASSFALPLSLGGCGASLPGGRSYRAPCASHARPPRGSSSAPSDHNGMLSNLTKQHCRDGSSAATRHPNLPLANAAHSLTCARPATSISRIASANEGRHGGGRGEASPAELS